LEGDKSHGFSNSLFISWQVFDVNTAYLMSEPSIWKELLHSARAFKLEIKPSHRRDFLYNNSGQNDLKRSSKSINGSRD